MKLFRGVPNLDDYTSDHTAQKLSFASRIYSVNVTKSTLSCLFGPIC